MRELGRRGQFSLAQFIAKYTPQPDSGDTANDAITIRKYDQPCGKVRVTVCMTDPEVLEKILV